jgi:hypothetical protein
MGAMKSILNTEFTFLVPQPSIDAGLHIFTPSAASV